MVSDMESRPLMEAFRGVIRTKTCDFSFLHVPWGACTRLSPDNLPHVS